MEDKVGFSTKICSVCLNKTVNFTQFKENSRKIAEELERKHNEIHNCEIKSECLESEFTVEDEFLHPEIKLEPADISTRQETPDPEIKYEVSFCQYCNKKMESYKNYRKIIFFSY